MSLKRRVRAVHGRAPAAKTHELIKNDPLLLGTVPLNTFLYKTHLERVMLVSATRDPEAPGRASLQGNFSPGHGYLVTPSGSRLLSVSRCSSFGSWLPETGGQWPLSLAHCHAKDQIRLLRVTPSAQALTGRSSWVTASTFKHKKVNFTSTIAWHLQVLRRC